jgi:hypothetical protein
MRAFERPPPVGPLVRVHGVARGQVQELEVGIPDLHLVSPQVTVPRAGLVDPHRAAPHACRIGPVRADHHCITGVHLGRVVAPGNDVGVGKPAVGDAVVHYAACARIGVLAVPEGAQAEEGEALVGDLIIPGINHVVPEVSGAARAARVRLYREARWQHPLPTKALSLAGPLILPAPLPVCFCCNRRIQMVVQNDVIFPILNGDDIVDRSRDTWVIDFSRYSKEEAALYQDPYALIADTAFSFRKKARDKEAVATWWKLWRPRAELRQKISVLERYILTPRVSKHRLFVWANKLTVPDDATVAIARDDDTSFGIVHSCFHEAWSLRKGTWLGVGNDPRYTPTTTFETFPFPEGLPPNIPAKDYADDPRAVAIAKAAKRLDELRNAWLNPPDLIQIVPEVVPGYPDRILPKNERAAAELKKRTLTNLYNQRPKWLADVHHYLDAAVAAAYGWPANISEEDALAKLLELNLKRAGTTIAVKTENEDEDEAE